MNLLAEVYNYSGDVYSKNGSNFLYKGIVDSRKKIATKENDCYDNNGNIIIQEHTEYLEATCEIISTHVRDYRTGKEEIIIDKGNAYLVRYKKNSVTEFVEKEIEKSGEIIHPTLLTMFMQKHMQEIMDQKSINVTLLLTNRLRTINFTISKLGIKKIDSIDCYEVILEPKSLVIRQFVKPIYFYVKKDDPSILVKYEGVIAPTDLYGNSQTGHIIFSFN